MSGNSAEQVCMPSFLPQTLALSLPPSLLPSLPISNCTLDWLGDLEVV